MRKRFIGEEEMLLDAFRLAVRIFDSAYRPSRILGVWPGGAVVGVYVHECLRHLGVTSDHCPLRVVPATDAVKDNTGDGHDTVQGLQHLADTLRRDDRVLIVQAVHATGRSARRVRDALAELAGEHAPRECRVASIWIRPAGSELVEPPDYFLHRSEDWLVMPHELVGLTVEELTLHRPLLPATPAAHESR